MTEQEEQLDEQLDDSATEEVAQQPAQKSEMQTMMELLQQTVAQNSILIERVTKQNQPPAPAQKSAVASKPATQPTQRSSNPPAQKSYKAPEVTDSYTKHTSLEDSIKELRDMAKVSGEAISNKIGMGALDNQLPNKINVNQILYRTPEFAEFVTAMENTIQNSSKEDIDKYVKDREQYLPKFPDFKS